MIAFLWAQDAQGTIGKNGTLPWHLPDDLKYFKQQTLGTLTVMGRKTYLALPKKPLPGRTNVVLSTDPSCQAPGAIVVHSAQELQVLHAKHPEQALVITGGAGVFESLKAWPDTLLVTRLAGKFDGDVTMVDLPWADYQLVASRTVENPDPALTHVFERWEKR
ncbi:dihydrofolate reductase [Lacticaseibacillus sp. N501-2]|uniref:dihydrofolate reductase n=1 Tax=Lacticaseibacillus salsurae TaxID=3367729 RepID=UPI0038B25DA0